MGRDQLLARVVERRGAWWRVRLQAQVRENFVDGMRLLNRRDLGSFPDQSRTRA